MVRGILGLSLAVLLACGEQGEPSGSESNADSGGATTSDDAASDDGVATTAATTTAEGDASGESGAPVTDPCDPGPSPMVWVGHGAGSFTELGSGPAQIVYGPQGGHHIVLGLHGQHLDASDAAVAELRGTIDGLEVGWSSPYAYFECRDPVLEALGLFLIFDAPPEQLHQQTLRIDVELTDAAGTVVMTSGEVMVLDPMQATTPGRTKT